VLSLVSDVYTAGDNKSRGWPLLVRETLPAGLAPRFGLFDGPFDPCPRVLGLAIAERPGIVRLRVGPVIAAGVDRPQHNGRPETVVIDVVDDVVNGVLTHHDHPRTLVPTGRIERTARHAPPADHAPVAG